MPLVSAVFHGSRETSGESSRKMYPVDILPPGSLPSFAMHFVSLPPSKHALPSIPTDVSGQPVAAVNFSTSNRREAI